MHEEHTGIRSWMIQDLAIALFHLLESMRGIEGRNWNIAAVDLHHGQNLIHFIVPGDHSRPQDLARTDLFPTQCCNFALFFRALNLLGSREDRNALRDGRK